jgi:hypothetical protein
MTAVARLISTHDTVERRNGTAPVQNLEVRGMPDLLCALRARRDQLELTHEVIDGIAGWAQGYAGKLLCDPPVKNLGWLSLGDALKTMAIKLVVVEDMEQRKLVERRWVKRERPRNAAPAAGKGRRHADQ